MLARISDIVKKCKCGAGGAVLGSKALRHVCTVILVMPNPLEQRPRGDRRNDGITARAALKEPTLGYDSARRQRPATRICQGENRIASLALGPGAARGVSMSDASQSGSASDAPVVAQVEFWFDFSSPYAYFAAVTIEDRLAPYGRPIVWRPFLLGVLFQKTGMTSLSRTPLRGDYARGDWQRLSRILDVPFALPPHHP